MSWLEQDTLIDGYKYRPTDGVETCDKHLVLRFWRGLSCDYGQHGGDALM